MWYWLEMLEEQLAKITTLEEMWAYWKHYDRQWNEYNISDMTDSHLINTIKYFWKLDYDIWPLLSEKNKR